MLFKEFWLGLPMDERELFAKRCGSTRNYFNMVAHGQKTAGEGLCIIIERESDAKVRCEDMRNDVDWAYLRRSDERRAHVIVLPDTPERRRTNLK